MMIKECLKGYLTVEKVKGGLCLLVGHVCGTWEPLLGLNLVDPVLGLHH